MTSDLPLRFSALVALAALLFACNKLDYKPVLPAEAVLKIYHMGAYSSQMPDDEKEVQGTLFQTQWKLSYKKQGDGWLVHRQLDTLFGRGYHKNSMPNELEKKIALDVELGSDGVPRTVTGYDSLLSVLSKIQQPDDYRKQLLKLSDPAFFQAEQQDLFRLRNFLPKGILKRASPLPVNDINSRLETVKLDSALYQGDNPRLDLRCLEYEAYYHRTDSLPLLVEQFFFSSSKHRKWKHSTWKPGQVDGIWHFSVERSTGLPCFESRSETGHITLNNPEDKSELPVTLIRYEEDVYTR